MSWQEYTKILIEECGSQTELAKIAGLPQPTISLWLNNGRRPSIKAVYRIWKHFDADLDELVTVAGR